MNLENLGVQEMNAQEIKQVEGGFFPIAIWGVVIAAEYVATAFFVGVGVGAMVAQNED